MKQIIIQQATPAHVATVHAITQEAFTQYAADLNLPQAVAALSETEADVLRDIQKKTVLIAYLGDTPAGVVRLQFYNGFTYITRFGVRLMAQGCGIGHALIRAAQTASHEMGMKALLLHTSTGIGDLMHFYYGQGFLIHSTTSDRGYIRALMVKELCKDSAANYDCLLG